MGKGLVAKQTGEKRDLAPEGKYFGVCVGVYDLGTQRSTKGYEDTHKVILEWELWKKKAICRDKENRPLKIAQMYPLAFGINPKTNQRSKLRAAVEQILGKTFTDAEAKVGYDLEQLLEIVVRLEVSWDRDKDGEPTYDNVKTYMSCDEDDPKLTPESDSVYYELDAESAIPDAVPDWIKKIIQRSVEWTKAHGDGESKEKPKASRKKATVPADDDEDGDGDEEDDDIPF